MRPLRYEKRVARNRFFFLAGLVGVLFLGLFFVALRPPPLIDSYEIQTVKPVIIATCPIQTPRGVFAAHYSAAGLARLDFPGRKKTAATPARFPGVRRWHKQAVRAVEQVLKGRAAGELPPLDLAAGTPFQKKVWAALRPNPRQPNQILRPIGRRARRAQSRPRGRQRLRHKPHSPLDSLPSRRPGRRRAGWIFRRTALEETTACTRNGHRWFLGVSSEME